MTKEIRPTQSILATDLDGTFIPLNGNVDNQRDLKLIAQELHKAGGQLVFVTGRHFQSVQRAIEENDLPLPDWIICDLGTTIYKRSVKDGFQILDLYHDHMSKIVQKCSADELKQDLKQVDGLQLQESEKQGFYKLSYYCEAELLKEISRKIGAKLNSKSLPYSIISSVDPFNGDGLIDLLPLDVNKAFALKWWCEKENRVPSSIIFAGDSGNDFAAFTSGFQTIVVGNAERELVAKVSEYHTQQQTKGLLYLANGSATSGVREGCQWFGLFSNELPIGATPVGNNSTFFRVWAPKANAISVQLEYADAVRCEKLELTDNGYFQATIRDVASGTNYRYLIDNDACRPDPASYFQPEGVHGPSQIVDHHAFSWTDHQWTGIPKKELIIYELHIGSFTEEGTYLSAIGKLQELKSLGVTAIELLPLAQSPGRWNWGYDGVNLYSPRNTYGSPNELKQLVDACHEIGLAIFLDVVYNHLGPEGNYLASFGPYFSGKHHTPWGDAFNYDDQYCDEVRNYIVQNAIYWLDKFHFDGLRLDAVHLMIDDSQTHILESICKAVQQFKKKVNREIHLIAESNIFDAELIGYEQGTLKYDAMWADCLMHSIYAKAQPELQLSHRHYYPKDLAVALENGFVFSGCKPERASHTQFAEAEMLDASSYLITSLQTHDSVGNHPQGKRFHQLASKEFQKAASALVLLLPSIPMIFMGEETASEAQFPFFADFEDEALREAVDKGRVEEYTHHDWSNSPLPSSESSYFSSKIDASKDDVEMREWYQQLLRLRHAGIREDWLRKDNLIVEINHEQHLYCLKYQTSQGPLCIWSRLTPLGEASDITSFTKKPTKILLSSEKIRVPNNNKLIFEHRHCIIGLVQL